MLVLQTHLDKLTDIVSSWTLSLNVGKCVVLRSFPQFAKCNIVKNKLEYKVGNRNIDC